jgi:hypothetical protein
METYKQKIINLPDTEERFKNKSTAICKVHKVAHRFIKLPMYLLFIWGWTWGGMGGNPFLGAFEGVGPEISTFLGTNGTRYARCHSRAQKRLDFRAHRFKIPSLWITPPSKSIRPASYKQLVY